MPTWLKWLLRLLPVPLGVAGAWFLAGWRRRPTPIVVNTASPQHAAIVQAEVIHTQTTTQIEAERRELDAVDPTDLDAAAAALNKAMGR